MSRKLPVPAIPREGVRTRTPNHGARFGGEGLALLYWVGEGGGQGRLDDLTLVTAMPAFTLGHLPVRRSPYARACGWGGGIPEAVLGPLVWRYLNGLP